jgi:hypothetical protein
MALQANIVADHVARSNLIAFLASGTRCSIQDLPHHWRQSTLRLICARPDDFEGGAWFPAALRGAWGHRLAEMAAGDDSGQIALSFETFFRGLGEATPGRSFPAPFTIQVDEAGAAVKISLTLHGIADKWREPAFDAFVSALKSGVAVRAMVRNRREPIQIFQADWSRSERIPVPSSTGPSWLRFHTPVRLGPRRALRAHWPDLILSLVDRLSHLCRWQGLTVDVNLSEWRGRAERMKFDDKGMRAETWDRRSGAQGGRQVPMMGLTGTLQLNAVPEVLLPLLAIGQHVHVGGHTALGLGRYELL